MSEFNNYTLKDLEGVKDRLDNIADKVANVSIDVAQVKTRVDMLYEIVNDYKDKIAIHEQTCPARKDIEKFKGALIKPYMLVIMVVILALATIASNIKLALNLLK